jgi:hypothetical protein
MSEPTLEPIRFKINQTETENSYFVTRIRPGVWRVEQKGSLPTYNSFLTEGNLWQVEDTAPKGDYKIRDFETPEAALQGWKDYIAYLMSWKPYRDAREVYLASQGHQSGT